MSSKTFPRARKVHSLAAIGRPLVDAANPFGAELAAKPLNVVGQDDASHAQSGRLNGRRHARLVAADHQQVAFDRFLGGDRRGIEDPLATNWPTTSSVKEKERIVGRSKGKGERRGRNRLAEEAAGRRILKVDRAVVGGAASSSLAILEAGSLISSTHSEPDFYKRKKIAAFSTILILWSFVFFLWRRTTAAFVSIKRPIPQRLPR